ncbi:MAG: ATP synthase F1 subunit epsilon [Vulcanimicrobiota bacterium]
MISNKTFQVEIVTPASTKFEGLVNELILPGVAGEMGILAGHAPLLAMLSPGQLIYETTEGQFPLAVGEGFATVANNKAVCLVDFALRPEEIDVAQANKEREEALEALKEEGSGSDALRLRLQAANAKLRVSGNA